MRSKWRPGLRDAHLWMRQAVWLCCLCGLGLLCASLGRAWAGEHQTLRRTAQASFADAEALKRVRFSVRMEPAVLRRDEYARVIVSAHIVPGWHVYALRPGEGEWTPPPARLLLKPSAGLEAAGAAYETPPYLKRDALFQLLLPVHQGEARFYQALRVQAAAPMGAQTLGVELHWQVCDERYCTPPQRSFWELALHVEEGTVRAPHAFVDRSVAQRLPWGALRELQGGVEDTLFGGGLGTWILLAAGFGLLALLTPCVLPLIPVTLGYFSTGSEQVRGRLLLCFAAGIVLSGVILGMLASLLWGASGLPQLAASGTAQILVALLLSFFALQLSGWTPLRLPASVQRLVQRLAANGHKPLGALGMGSAFTLSSFTCTMPFVGSLLIGAASGSWLRPLIGLSAFSTAFAMPFLLLAAGMRYPRWLLAGPWMIRLRRVLAALELMAAFKFVSNAALVWGWDGFGRRELLFVWTLLALWAAFVCAGGRLWPRARESIAQNRPRGLALVPAFGLAAGGVYFAWGGFGATLDPITETYMPPFRAERPAPSSTPLLWHSDLRAAKALAQTQQRPVLVDFTAYTCVNCRWMEQYVFTAPQVAQLMRKEFILLRLYTDGGPTGDANRRLQLRSFRTTTLPYYVVLAPDGTLLARYAGLAQQEVFRAWLTEALLRWQPPVGVSRS